MIGRHANAATRASEARRFKAIAIADAVVVFTALTAVVITLAVDNAPSVHAAEVPQPPKVTQPAPVAGPVQPIFDFADVQPWDPGKESVAVKSQPVVTSRSAKRVVAARKAAQRPVVAAPVSVDPPKAPEATQPVSVPVPVEPPAKPAPVTPTVVGLPPVVVVETPPVVVAEQPPAVTAKEEPPVNVPVVVEPATEVAP